MHCTTSGVPFYRTVTRSFPKHFSEFQFHAAINFTLICADRRQSQRIIIITTIWLKLKPQPKTTTTNCWHRSQHILFCVCFVYLFAPRMILWAWHFTKYVPCLPHRMCVLARIYVLYKYMHLYLSFTWNFNANTFQSTIFNAFTLHRNWLMHVFI